MRSIGGIHPRRHFCSDLLKITAGEWSADLPAALAVLDFQNEMDAPADDWIGSGMAESLELDLARTVFVDRRGSRQGVEGESHTYVRPIPPHARRNWAWR